MLLDCFSVTWLFYGELHGFWQQWFSFTVKHKTFVMTFTSAYSRSRWFAAVNPNYMQVYKHSKYVFDAIRQKTLETQKLIIILVRPHWKRAGRIRCRQGVRVLNNPCCLLTELWDEKTRGISFLYKLMVMKTHTVTIWHTVLRQPQPLMYNKQN